MTNPPSALPQRKLGPQELPIGQEALQVVRATNGVAVLKRSSTISEDFAERWYRWTSRLLEALKISDVCWDDLGNEPGELILLDPTAKHRVGVLCEVNQKSLRPTDEVAKALDEVAERWFLLRNGPKIAKPARRSGPREHVHGDGFGRTGTHLTQFGWHAFGETNERRWALQAAVRVLGWNDVYKKLCGCRLANWYPLHQRAVNDDIDFMNMLSPNQGGRFEWCIYV